VTPEKPCVFNRDSKCVFEGGHCDQDCGRARSEENIQSNEKPEALDVCQGEGSRRLGFTRIFQSFFLSFFNIRTA